MSTALLVGPVAYHRLVFRGRQKEPADSHALTGAWAGTGCSGRPSQTPCRPSRRRPGRTVRAAALAEDHDPVECFGPFEPVECLYYFTGADLHRVLDFGVTSLRPGGTLLAVHWRHPVADHPLRGDDVHAALAGRAGRGLAKLVQHAEPDFLADVYLRTDGEPVSVAQAGGLV